MEGSPYVIVGQYKYHPVNGQLRSGLGSFATVYKGQSINNSQKKVAIKVLNQSYEDIQPEEFKEITQEFNLLKLIGQHSNDETGVIKAYEWHIFKYNQHQQKIAMVFELMDGSLYDLIKQQSCQGKGLKQERAKQILKLIVNSYRQIYNVKLSGKHIIHRDLKPENILYKRNSKGELIVKICDFGTSRFESHKSMSCNEKGTRYYMSPQQRLTGQYTSKLDVYALGVIYFEMLNGKKKIPIQLGYIDQSTRETNHKAIEQALKEIEVSQKSINFINGYLRLQEYFESGSFKYMENFVNGCLQFQQKDRLSWEQVFDHQIFKEDLAKQIKIQIVETQITQTQNSSQDKFQVTPDTTTYAWKQNKYRQHNINKNACIYQGEQNQSEWLCSSYQCDGECVFTIKVQKVKSSSFIQVGIMDIKCKGRKYKDTFNHCVYLLVPLKKIYTPNQEQTEQEWIKCSCQPFLESLPCLIECHVNCDQNTITWHYNGKNQANSTMPNSWKDGRKLCAVVDIWNQGDTVEFV